MTRRFYAFMDALEAYLERLLDPLDRWWWGVRRRHPDWPLLLALFVWAVVVVYITGSR